MGGRSRVACVLAATVAGVVGVVAPGAAVDKKGQVTEFSAGISPGAQPGSIAAGPDGNVWFIEERGERIGRITPAGEITEFSAGSAVEMAGSGITAGPDGNVWFTERTDRASDLIEDRIARITPTGELTEFSAGITPKVLDGQAYSPGVSGITAGPDGNLWFTEYDANRIGRITPTGEVTEFSEGITPDKIPTEIAAGPDGNLWFTEAGYQDQQTGQVHPGGIGRITPAGVVTEFSSAGFPSSITTGCDGNLWFTEPFTTIWRMTPKGKVTDFSASEVTAITTGPDGNLWFTAGGILSDAGDQVSPGAIGRITPKGKVSDFSAGISPDAYLNEITAGPDGNLWFTESRVDNRDGRIGRIGPGPAAKPRGKHGPTLPPACPRSPKN